MFDDIEQKLLKKIKIVEKLALKVELKHVTLRKAEYFYLKPDYKQKYIYSKLLSLKESFRLGCGADYFEPINHRSLSSFFTYGMISSPTGSKIDDLVYLFNSTDESNVPIKLDLSNLSSHSLFNGQIVALLGSNSQGNAILVEKIFYMPHVNTNLENKQNLSMEVCKGPFTQESIQQVFNELADIYVFMGPFTGTSNGLFEKLEDFTHCVDEHLTRYPKAKAIVIPSVEDDLAVKLFPQPALHIISNRIQSYPNPCYFYANNHLISVCNFDNLVDLAFEEKFKNDPSNSESLFKADRLSRLAYHLVHQQSFVPVLSSLSNVSYGNWLDMEVAPDLYIISSKLKFTHNKIESCTVMNSNSKCFNTVKSQGNSVNYNIQTTAFSNN